ncbi:helix-turn-helix domain-containing protein [Antarcticirhabdus aurantiaca]|uniref:Helix-turn-helix transcriptional regulator n=2 Tax=Antarcticirhabdus aurantiaca TaxID=2606717 RepID=A0ACD4NRE5_9HYPH|nr:helix-turn-helix transcriptional regulator [Jeongeuplla avenae]
MRKKKGLSLSAVGRGVGTTYQQVRKYESGENRISASSLYRVAQLLDVDVAEFFRDLPVRANAGTPRPGDDAKARDDAFAHIADPEIRQHLEALLRVLGGRR